MSDEKSCAETVSENRKSRREEVNFMAFFGIRANFHAKLPRVF